MVTRQLLLEIDGRLKQLLGSTEPFAGLSVILMGDLHQLPAVGGSLCAAALARTTAGELFCLFTVDRFQRDVAHMNDLRQLSDMQLQFPVTESLLRRLRVLTRDVLDDPGWVHAPIGVTNNDKWCDLQDKGAPVLRFQFPLAGTARGLAEQRPGLAERCMNASQIVWLFCPRSASCA